MCWKPTASSNTDSTAFSGVVIEDYLEKALGRQLALILNLFLCVLACGLGVFSVLKLAFTHGVV